MGLKRYLEQLKIKKRFEKMVRFEETNSRWLDFSYPIAIHILSKMHQYSMDREAVRKGLGWSKKEFDKFLSGKKNLNLKEIRDLEIMFDTEILNRENL